MTSYEALLWTSPRRLVANSKAAKDSEPYTDHWRRLAKLRQERHVYSNNRPDRSAKLRRSGMEWDFGLHSPQAMPERTRTHAAPTELGGLCGTYGYKHGAPNGAFRAAAAAPQSCERFV